jgi:hypothetical protein
MTTISESFSDYFGGAGMMQPSDPVGALGIVAAGSGDSKAMHY